jgi:hypothetical protein
MAQASERPRRKRLSWESRCEIVWLIEQGMSPLWPPPARRRSRPPGSGSGEGVGSPRTRAT